MWAAGRLLMIRTPMKASMKPRMALAVPSETIKAGIRK